MDKLKTANARISELEYEFLDEDLKESDRGV